jgi:hypothetical protein
MRLLLRKTTVASRIGGAFYCDASGILLLVTTSDFVGFDQLASADLVVDRTYRGGTTGGLWDEPLSKLLPVRNLGGFRPYGRPTKLVVSTPAVRSPIGRTRSIRTPDHFFTTETTGRLAERCITPPARGISY